MLTSEILGISIASTALIGEKIQAKINEDQTVSAETSMQLTERATETLEDINAAMVGRFLMAFPLVGESTSCYHCVR